MTFQAQNFFWEKFVPGNTAFWEQSRSICPFVTKNGHFSEQLKKRGGSGGRAPTKNRAGFEEQSDDVGISRPAGPGILEHSEKIRKGEKAAGDLGAEPPQRLQGTASGLLPAAKRKNPPERGCRGLRGLRGTAKGSLIGCLLWSLQGMILRPPDYESDALTN